MPVTFKRTTDRLSFCLQSDCQLPYSRSNKLSKRSSPKLRRSFRRSFPKTASQGNTPQIQSFQSQVLRITRIPRAHLPRNPRSERCFTNADNFIHPGIIFLRRILRGEAFMHSDKIDRKTVEPHQRLSRAWAEGKRTKGILIASRRRDKGRGVAPCRSTRRARSVRYETG